MAKNFHEKKKRIARLTSFDHEYHDIVSTIMNGMDNNLPSTYSNKFEADLFESHKIFSKKAQNTVQNNANQKCMSVPKSKKFGLSRKFPLMEKSQRALKQIRHNRKIPKPRAHLAGLSDLPLSTEKSKINKVKEKNIEKIQNKKLANKTVHRKVTASGSGRNEKLIVEPKNKTACKKKEPAVMNKNETIKKSFNSLNNSSKESDDSSSDAEFERFIRDEKKDLPKTQKSTKKRSLSTSKKVSKKRASSKDISRPVGREKYSDMSDEELPKPNQRITTKRKILRNRQSRVSVEKNSDSEMDVCNETYHDSSSESDGVGLMSANNSCGSQLNEQGYKSVPQFNSHLQETAVSSLISNNQSSIEHKTHTASLESNDQRSIPHAVSLMNNNQPTVMFNTSHSLLVNNQPNLMHKVCDVSSVANKHQSNIVNKTYITSLESNDQPNIPHAVSLMPDNSQPTTTIVKSKSVGICDIKNDPVSVICSSPNNSDQSVFIDLVDSDDECENTFTKTPKIVAVSGPNQNELPSHSDESEIEVVDVVVHDLPNESKKNVKPQSSKENILIKTEPVNQTVKSTNILNKTVKNEPCDDCEIIFDAASTSNVTKMTNIQKCSNPNVKNEIDFEKLALSACVPNNGSFAPEKKNKLAQKEERLHEVACSNLRNIANLQKSLEPLEKDTVNVKSLLEALKKALTTYKEILETEQSVEATFKLLERHQAEKLTLLKSQIAQHLKSSGISDNCNAIKNVMTSLLDTQLSSCKTLKDGIQDVSLKSDISVEDLKTYAAINIVPLSSIPANDIKPDVSQLQCTLKQEDSVTYEANNMSFGEKCIVCAKHASAACQQCAKVFFCSNECGVKYWENGHKNTCVK